ncbi:MAG TPA: hypothetical protein VFC78_14585 [Tepidisphaeraceae bacterium]|nr:hypothetical protein [Tepidisphaeraceae bacterium]
MDLRFISPRMHMIVDYMTAVILPIVPRVAGWDPTVTHLHDAVAGTIATVAATTDTELGIVKAVPMKAHLIADGVSGATLLTLATLMEDEPCEARCCIGTVGAFLIVQALCTKTQPGMKPTADNAGRKSSMQRYAQERRPDAAYSYGG